MTLLIILTLLQVADVITIHKILKGGGIEKNPVARWLIDKGGLGALIGFKAVSVLILAGLYLLPEARFYLSIAIGALCLLYIGVIINNLMVLRKL